MSITNIDSIMRIEIFRQEVFKFPQIPSPFICHLRQPDIFPNSNIVTLDILQKQSYVHEKIKMVRLFNLVVFLSIHHKYFVFWVLGRKDVDLCIIEGWFYDVQFVWRKRGQSEVTYLPYFTLVSCLYRKRCCLEMKR